MLLQCGDNVLHNITDAVSMWDLPALKSLCIQKFEGYDVDIVQTLSQLGVSCHKTCVLDDDFHHRGKCFCEI